MTIILLLCLGRRCFRSKIFAQALSGSCKHRGGLVAALMAMFGCLCWLSGCSWNGGGQNTQGVALFNQGRFTEALQQFETAKQTDPTNPDTYYNLASTYHRVGNTNKDSKMLQNSEALYNQCLDLSPNHVDCHRGLAVLLVDTGRSDKAFGLLKNWAQNNPGLSDPRVELARLHQEFNQTKISTQYLDEALAMDPNNARAWAARGKVRENSGELMQAVQNYQQSLAINAKQPELYHRISSLHVRLAQSSAATGPTTLATTAGTPSAGGTPATVASLRSGSNSAENSGGDASKTGAGGGGSTAPSPSTRY